MISKQTLKVVSCTLVLLACGLSLLGFQGANTFPIRRSGTITAGNCAQWVDARTVKDSGGVCGASGSVAFSALTASTNSTAAMVVGTGASLAASGSGTITATAVPVGGISGLGAGVATLLGAASSGTGAPLGGTSPTITTPTVASFVNATHTHQNAAGGGTLDGAAIASGTVGGQFLPGLMMFGGYSSATPSGTQQFGATYRSTIGAGSTNYSIAGRAFTATGINVSLTAAEGAAATMSFTLATCTTAACSTFSTTALTCTVGNSVQVCSQSGQAVAISAGALFVIQTVQSGTGTAAVGSASITYY